jgi:hypothetical protein
LYHDGTSFYPQHLAVDDAIRHLGIRRGNDVAECLTRDLHAGSGLLLVEALQMGKAHGLKLIQGEHDLG